MAATTEVGFHLCHPQFPIRHRFLLLHTQRPLCHSNCRPIHIYNRRLLLLLSPWPLHIRGSRQWDSNAESYNTNNFNFDADDEIEGSDDSVEEWVEALEGYIDSIWIFKVFRSFGWMLPPVLFSMLIATGPKAFLMALALPLGQSTFAFAIRRFQNRGKIKPKRKSKTRKGRSRSYGSRVVGLEEAPEFNGSQGARKKKKGYQSWVPKDDVNFSTKDKSSTNFGGWDELDSGIDSNIGSSRRADKRSSGFREAPAQKAKTERLGASNGPLLLRLLISVFPFLSFWAKVLKTFHNPMFQLGS